jgi:hypothetical protein
MSQAACTSWEEKKRDTFLSYVSLSVQAEESAGLLLGDQLLDSPRRLPGIDISIHWSRFYFIVLCGTRYSFYCANILNYWYIYGMVWGLCSRYPASIIASEETKKRCWPGTQSLLMVAILHIVNSTPLMKRAGIRHWSSNARRYYATIPYYTYSGPVRSRLKTMLIIDTHGNRLLPWTWSLLMPFFLTCVYIHIYARQKEGHKYIYLTCQNWNKFISKITKNRIPHFYTTNLNGN